MQLRDVNRGDTVRNKIETLNSSDQKNQTFILEHSDKCNIEE
jgi:hypothetical protein